MKEDLATEREGRKDFAGGNLCLGEELDRKPPQRIQLTNLSGKIKISSHSKGKSSIL